MDATTDEKLSRLRREAEMEMRRVLDTSRPHKRQRGDPEETPFVPVDRFRYAVINDLEAGAKGFIVTCNFRREKSATREASQLLRRYMPGHLFPEQAPDPSTETGQVQQLGPPLPGTARGPAPQDIVLAPVDQENVEFKGSRAVGHDTATAAAVAVAGPKAAATERTARGGDGREGTVANGNGDTEAIGSESGSDGEDEGEGGGPDYGGEGAGAAGPASGSAGADTQPSALGLAKVACRGVVMMRLSAAAAAEVDPVKVVERLLADLDTGALKPPRHCQRIIPLDSTGLLTASGLSAAVAAAAAAHKLRQGTPAAGGAGIQPFSYAVVYHSRVTETPGAASAGGGGRAAASIGGGGAAPGSAPSAAAAGAPGAAAEIVSAPEVEAGDAPDSAKQQQQQQQRDPGAALDMTEAKGADVGGAEPLTDRGRIISLVAGGMAAAFGPAASVNLKKPTVAVLVEAIPVAGRKFAGLALLPQHMLVTKSRMGVKPLAKNAPAH